MNDQDKISSILRAMAWDRTKGELKSMLSTFDTDDFEKYETFNEKIKEFISWVEYHEYNY